MYKFHLNLPIKWLCVGTCVFAGLAAWGASPSPRPSPSPNASHRASPLPSPVASPLVSPLPSPTVAQGLSPREAQTLLREYLRALKSEIKAMEHRHSAELKDLKASQSARRNEWREKEESARHSFFASHPKGRDQRGYVQDYLRRLKTLDQILKEERKSREKEQEARLQSLKQQQADRLKEFQQALAKNQRPPESLWPKPGS